MIGTSDPSCWLAEARSRDAFGTVTYSTTDRMYNRNPVPNATGF